MNICKWLFAAALLVGLAASGSFADTYSNTIETSVVRSTGTSGVLAFSGTGKVYALFLSSGTGYAVIRDTNTANTSSTVKIPPITYTTSSQTILFNPPIRINNGLSVNNTVEWGVGSTAATMGAAVQYKKGQ